MTAKLKKLQKLSQYIMTKKN